MKELIFISDEKSPKNFLGDMNIKNFIYNIYFFIKIFYHKMIQKAHTDLTTTKTLGVFVSDDLIVRFLNQINVSYIIISMRKFAYYIME